MTIIQIAPKLLIAFYLLAFAIYDIRHKVVKNDSLIFMLIAVVYACSVEIWYSEHIWWTLTSMITGGVSGGGILLAAAMATDGGIGGGDIKLAAVLGLAVGVMDMQIVLCIASVLAFAYGLIKRRIKRDKELHIAFVPFMAIGYYAIFIPQIWT